MKLARLYMQRAGLAVCLWVLSLAPDARGLDGKREGFIIGLGAGVTPKLHWEGTSDSISMFGESTFGVGISGLVGYAFDERNLLVIESNGAIALGGSLPGLAQRFLGPTWYHYYGRVGSSLFTVLSGGIYQSSFEVQEVMGILGATRNGLTTGLGIMVGGGFEFAAHAQIGLYLSGGALSGEGLDYSGYHVSVLLTGVGY
jgi:hypothetical protein